MFGKRIHKFDELMNFLSQNSCARKTESSSFSRKNKGDYIFKYYFKPKLILHSHKNETFEYIEGVQLYFEKYNQELEHVGIPKKYYSKTDSSVSHFGLQRSKTLFKTSFHGNIGWIERKYSKHLIIIKNNISNI